MCERGIGKGMGCVWFSIHSKGLQFVIHQDFFFFAATALKYQARVYMYWK